MPHIEIPLIYGECEMGYEKATGKYRVVKAGNKATTVATIYLCERHATEVAETYKAFGEGTIRKAVR